VVLENQIVCRSTPDPLPDVSAWLRQLRCALVSQRKVADQQAIETMVVLDFFKAFMASNFKLPLFNLAQEEISSASLNIFSILKNGVS
jgi:hypothetical protein